MSRTICGVILWLSLFATSALAGEMKQEIRTDRIDYFLNAAFSRYGYNPNRTLGLERSGVTFRIAKAPKDSTQAGIYSHFSLAGDFEYTVDFDLANLAKPTTGYGMSIGIAIHTKGEQGAVFLTRTHHTEWGQCFVVTHEIPKPTGNDYESEPFPTTARKGKLQIRRVGTDLVLSVAEPKGEFKQLKKMPFNAEPITQVRLYCDTGGADLSLEGRLSNIHIKADAINGAAIPPPNGFNWWYLGLFGSVGLLAVAGVFRWRQWKRERDEA